MAANEKGTCGVSAKMTRSDFFRATAKQVLKGGKYVAYAILMGAAAGGCSVPCNQCCTACTAACVGCTDACIGCTGGQTCACTASCTWGCQYGCTTACTMTLTSGRGSDYPRR